MVPGSLRGVVDSGLRVPRTEPSGDRDAEGQRVLIMVSKARGVSPELLLHHSRCRADVALARQLAMYLMHVVLQRQYKDIGRFFGRDRTTVWHACAVVEDLREDLVFDAEVERLSERLETACEPQRHAAA